MGALQDLRRQVSSLKATVAARDRTIARLRDDLQGANALAGRLEGALANVAEGLRPLAGAAAKAGRLAETASSLPEGGLREIERYGELLPLLTENGLLEQLRALGPIASQPLPGGGTHEEFKARLTESLGQVIDEIEALAARMPDPPDLPLRPLLQLMTRLLDEAPEAARARLRSLWKAGRIFPWLKAIQETHGGAVRIALMEAVVAWLGTLSAMASVEFDLGGEVAAAYAAGVGAGASITAFSLGSLVFGLPQLVLESRIILLDKELERLPEIGT